MIEKILMYKYAEEVGIEEDDQDTLIMKLNRPMEECPSLLNDFTNYYNQY